MIVYELDISWATTASERRRLRWELTAADGVKGAFLTARDDALAVLYQGDRRDYEALAQTLGPEPLEAAW
jgi:hypothetical protein